VTDTGLPIWYELVTPDVEGAKRFYGEVVGWTTTDMPTGEGTPPYTIWTASQGEPAAVGGLMPRPAEAPMEAGWYAYFHVADVDAKVAENQAAGGRTHMGGYDIPEVGRIALVEDPQGIVFYLMTPAPPAGTPADARSTSFSDTLPQRCAWNELVTTDHKAALRHYGSLFGWVSNEAMPMGPMGDYSFVDAGPTRIGAMMDRAAPEKPLRWTFYFKVPDADAAAEQVRSRGGQVVMGPMEVPGGQRIIVAVDPQGASVGFVSGEGA
jgi:uncharacterized protein